MFFIPYKMVTEEGTEWFVDGGVSKDFPIDLVENPGYIGHVIQDPKVYCWNKVSVSEMAMIMLSMLVHANIENSISAAVDGGIIVRTDYSKSMMDFKVSDEEKRQMLDLGYKNMKTALRES